MMKRGLSTRDPQHISTSLLRRRQEPIRDELRRRGLDAAVLVCDISTGSDIAYLTHLTLYWSTGLLVIGADGSTAFMPALSPRTENWFSATGEFDEVRSGTDLIGSLRAISGEHGYRRLGLIERDRFPQGLLRDIESDDAFETDDLGEIVRDLRAVPDEVARSDLHTAAEFAEAALVRFGDSTSSGANATEAAADAEYALRMAGVWDASVVPTPVGDGVNVRLRCQLRDAWVAVERSMGDQGGRQWWEDLRDWLLPRLRPERTTEDLHTDVLRYVAAHPFDGADIWETVVEPSADIEARAGMAESRPLVEGMAAHVSISAWDENGALLVRWGNTVLIDSDGTVRCLISEE